MNKEEKEATIEAFEGRDEVGDAKLKDLTLGAEVSKTIQRRRWWSYPR